MTVRKILHAADIHLDSPLLRLESYPNAPVEEIRSASRKALTNLVDLAIGEAVDLVVIAGDLYDGDWNECTTGLYFISEASRLIRMGIPLVVIRGNHDAANVMTQTLPLPKNPDGTPIVLDHTSVDRRVFDDLGIVVHGRSFPTRAVVDDLSQQYPSPITGMFNIGLLHTCLTGADGHDNYAPCNPRQLQEKGYDYWALGHIHDRRSCHIHGETPIVFPGNIQGRNIREVGPKGCVIVSVGDDHKPTTTFHPLDVVRWQVCEHDAADDQSTDDLLEAFGKWVVNEVDTAQGRPIAARVIVKGATKLNDEYQRNADKLAQELRSISMTQVGGVAWLENIKVRTGPMARLSANGQTLESDSGAEAGQSGSDDAIGSIRHVIDTLRNDNELLGKVIEPLKAIWRKLPSELTASAVEPFRLDDAELVNSWLDACEPILVDLLQGPESRK